jgi:hypothetical protein
VSSPLFFEVYGLVNDTIKNHTVRKHMRRLLKDQHYSLVQGEFWNIFKIGRLYLIITCPDCFDVDRIGRQNGSLSAPQGHDRPEPPNERCAFTFHVCKKRTLKCTHLIRIGPVRSCQCDPFQVDCPSLNARLVMAFVWPLYSRFTSLAGSDHRRAMPSELAVSTYCESAENARSHTHRWLLVCNSWNERQTRISDTYGGKNKDKDEP